MGAEETTGLVVVLAIGTGVALESKHKAAS